MQEQYADFVFIKMYTGYLRVIKLKLYEILF